ARPMRPVPMTAMVLPVTSSPRNGRNGCHEGHFCLRTSRSLCHIFLASMPIMKNANSAVASVSTSAVLVNGILYLLASARLMLSNPTAICATTFSVPFPASNTSESIGSRSVVIKPSMLLFTFSMIKFLGGASGPWKISRSYPRARRRFSAASPMRDVAKTRKRPCSAILVEECNQELRIAGNFLSKCVLFAGGRIDATDEDRNFWQAPEYIISFLFVLARIHKAGVGNRSDTHVRGFRRGDT